MKTAQFRRKLNDSYLGEKLNNSLLGLVFEGLTREVFEPFFESRTPENHYSFKSKLYELEKNYKDEVKYVRKIPLDSVIFGKIADYSPKLAWKLNLATIFV